MGDDGPRDRGPNGTFTAEHTDAEIVAAVRAHEPAATSEVADELGIRRQSADYRLRRLRDAGRVSSKKIGASLVWFPADDTPTSERRETPQAPADETPDPSGPEIDERHDAASSADVYTAALEAVDVPGTVDLDDARDALQAAAEELQQRGRATKGELVAAVMPDHPLGYDVDAALAKIDATDERYRGAWWRRVVKPALTELDAVDAPARGASDWKWTD